VRNLPVENNALHLSFKPFEVLTVRLETNWPRVLRQTRNTTLRLTCWHFYYGLKKVLDRPIISALYLCTRC